MDSYAIETARPKARVGYISGFGSVPELQLAVFPVLVHKDHRDDSRFDKAHRSVPLAFIEPHARSIAEQQEGRRLDRLGALGGLDWRELLGAVTDRSPHTGALAAMPMLAVVRELSDLLAVWFAKHTPPLTAGQEAALRKADQAEADPKSPFKISDDKIFIDQASVGTLSAEPLKSGEISADLVEVHGPVTIWDESGYVVGGLAPVGMRLVGEESTEHTIPRDLADKMLSARIDCEATARAHPDTAFSSNITMLSAIVHHQMNASAPADPRPSDIAQQVRQTLHEHSSQVVIALEPACAGRSIHFRGTFNGGADYAEYREQSRHP